MTQIQITVGDISLLVQPRNTPTATAILDALPITSTARTWGDEVYFSVPVNTELEADAHDVVEAGELAFWVEGNCIAIGFGRTPVSQGDEIRLAARTNIWADSETDVRQLTSARTGDAIKVERID